MLRRLASLLEWLVTPVESVSDLLRARSERRRTRRACETRAPRA
ncbi:MAG: hypothetical protein Q8R60_11585 [Mycobacteriales bacterium]|nr:hypothetical protein [Mycobacteriales bacterium]